MLPTFVIGLREGLEAALIVSIIATFLRRNGSPLRAMWIGVLAGVLLSIAVGVVLDVVEQSLPQAEQEGMETVIGLIAVFFVTGMIVWMRHHARYLKRDLEAAASSALASGTSTALAVMAFLAVLREGFETSVFLLATFQNAGSAQAAVVGAVLGILLAIVLGWAIYVGGLRLNLHVFFTYTGIFLVFVAAGLIMSACRTAHEAGWLNVGQGSTIDLRWLAQTGTIRSALITGVLGIQPDPRVVELLAWGCYLVPMLVIMYLPTRLRPAGALAQRLRYAGAAALAVAAVVLATVVPAAATPHADLPEQVDLTTLMGYSGNRVPVGIDPQTAPGPYSAKWTQREGSSYVLTLTGGGLTVARTLSVDVPTPASTDPGSNRPLWRRWFPLVLIVAAAGLLGQAYRRRASGDGEEPSSGPVESTKGHHVPSKA